MCVLADVLSVQARAQRSLDLAAEADMLLVVGSSLMVGVRHTGRVGLVDSAALGVQLSIILHIV